MAGELPPIELFAWVGEDEFGSGEVGIKQALCPAGCIPMVSVSQRKIAEAYIVEQMQEVVRKYRKRRQLVRFVPVEVVREIIP
jgi:small ligand-binding sensory domain FIST